ncbi:DUF4367 domain-containing protein [Halobacillus sp. Nhm2S1]|uniref:DUF4367 domain-containing protein n=1 Tax=Halobacillus sp. Nhm2S1 TaxID=2866716 RepID=UPI001C73D6E8|nr:DUF4367 domain-containing protein [Halobacillus sp. Nhm2S1]MBX0356807.1 DUF4367 domain-containing protein [Halobacillus sp. Nhm2S1]
MKKLILLIALPVFIVGCGSTDGLQEFDPTGLNEELEKVSFQPQLPTELPFEVKQADLSRPPELQQPVNTLNFDFYGEGNEHLSLLTVNGSEVSSTSEEDYQEVEIDHISGGYFINDSGDQTLRWQEGDIQYVLKSMDQGSESDVSKADLIKMAESFE